MTLGSISTFPINTILEYATSGQFGLCPKLKSSINQLNVADSNSPASEKAVRDSIDLVSETITYTNLDNGYNVYNNSSGNIALYNTINVSGSFLTGYINDNCIILSGYGLAGSGLLTTGNISVQGGIYQYSNSFNADIIQATGNIIANTKIDDVIGKLFIYCQTPFTQNGSTYSIGIDGDEERYITKFDAPSGSGLVSTTYNNTMSGEYDWITTNKEIKLYRYGSQCAAGRLGVSIFYDKVNWIPNYGYIMDKTNIQRFNINNETYSLRGSNMLLSYYPGVISNNYYIYSAGGYNGSSDINNVQRYDAKIDTISSINRGNLTGASRSYINTFKSSTKMYFSCGQLGTSNTTFGTTENILLATDTANSNINVNLTSRSMVGIVYDNVKSYIAGGYNSLQTNNAYNIIEKVIYSSDTTSTTISTLGNNRYAMARFNTNVDGWLIGGVKYNTSYNDNQNYMDKINYSTDTINSSSSILTLNYSMMQSVQNNTYGYLLGGRVYSSSINGTVHNDIQKVQFSTNTFSVITNVINSSTTLINDIGASV